MLTTDIRNQGATDLGIIIKEHHIQHKEAEPQASLGCLKVDTCATIEEIRVPINLLMETIKINGRTMSFNGAVHHMNSHTLHQIIMNLSMRIKITIIIHIHIKIRMSTNIPHKITLYRRSSLKRC